MVQWRYSPCVTPQGWSSVHPDSTNSAACGQISQLEVCQLLHSNSQVIYPIALNGCKASMVASLPKSLARGANLLGDEPIYLKVGIQQSTAVVSELKALPCHIHPPHPNGQLHQGYLAKGRGRGQHDQRSVGTLDLGSIRHIWTWVDKLNPKETKSHGCAHTSAPQTGRSLQSS